MICIYDFAGSYDHPGRWADIIRPERVVRFGGWWDVVPDIPLPTGASANQAIDLANTVLARYDVVNSIAFPITHLEKDEII